MKKYFVWLIVLLFFSCDKEAEDLPMENPIEEEIIIPPEAVEIFDFETQSTHQDSVSLYASDKDKYSSFISVLNGEEVDLFASITLRDAGYYELKVVAVSDIETIDQLYQFVIVDAERGEAEWALKKFTPQEIEDKSFALGELDFLFPDTYPKDLSLPIIFSAKVSKDSWKDFYSHLTIDNHVATIKRGIGSILLPPERSVESITADLNGQQETLTIIDSEPEFIPLIGVIDNDMELEEDGHYHIAEDLTIASGTSLHIPEGCIVKVNEGINIHNNGQILIQGNAAQPVVFACADSDTYWGGFISTGSNARIEVEHAIFTQSGFNDGPEYQYGHAKRQALFYVDDSEVTIQNTYAIDHIGQVFYLTNKSNLTIENTLIQRAKTAGEVSGSDIVISECTFTDFPEYSTRYLDEDNDCMYLSYADAQISNSAFMWSKDDGIDSGFVGGGNVQISNCHFEGIFHEAVALSSGGTATKKHEISNSTFFNNGQGVELGYSSPNHQVTVENCHFESNMIGVRYGDNYDRVVSGKMELINCSFGMNHDKDIWNFVRSEWAGIDENLIY